jgi:hypothetical protein
VGLTHEKQSTPGKAIALAAIVEAGMWTQSGAAAQCRTRRQRPHVESALFDLRPPTSAADWTCVGSGIHTQQLSPGKLVTGSFRVLAERQMRQNERQGDCARGRSDDCSFLRIYVNTWPYALRQLAR